MPSNELVSNNEVNLRIRVRYAECDAQNVVFNARYADYADIAATEYIRALIGDYNNLLNAGFDNQVVSMHIDWIASAKFDDILNLKVSLHHVGNSSFTLLTQCSKVKDEQYVPIAEMKIVYVVVNTTSFKKSPIPDILRENFKRKFSELVNQAG